MATQRVWSASPYEQQFGFCRGLRMGPLVQISGTAPLDEQGQVHAPGDAYAQAVRCLVVGRQALEQLGASLEQVYRVRWYLTEIADQGAVGQAHAEFFKAHPPTATMVQVVALVDPAMRVEVELEAWSETPHFPAGPVV